MIHKNTFRVYLKRLLLSAFLLYFFIFPNTTFAQSSVTSDSLLDAFQTYVKPPLKPVAINQADLLNAYKNYVVEPAPQLATVSQSEVFNAFRDYVAQALPPSQPKADQPPAEASSSATPRTSANSADVSLLTALRNLLNRPDIAAQLRGPSGPAGPSGATGPQRPAGS